MMDYMSSDIDSRWVFHTNEESNKSKQSELSVIKTDRVARWNGGSQRFRKYRHDCENVTPTLLPDFLVRRWGGR